MNDAKKYIVVVRDYETPPVGIGGGANLGFGKGSLEIENDKISVIDKKGEKKEFVLSKIESIRIVISYISGWNSFFEFKITNKSYIRVLFKNFSELYEALDQIIDFLEKESINYSLKGNFARAQYRPYSSAMDDFEMTLNDDGSGAKGSKKAKLKDMLANYKKVRDENLNDGAVSRYFDYIVKNNLKVLFFNFLLIFAFMTAVIYMYEDNVPKDWAEPYLIALRLIAIPFLIYIMAIVVAVTSVEDYKIFSYKKFKKRFFRTLVPIIIFGALIYMFK